MNRVLVLVVITALSGSLMACGKRGPLSLPDAPPRANLSESVGHGPF